MWLLILYYDINKKHVLRYVELNTIKTVAYLLGLQPNRVSNFFHKLIKPRGPLNYCNLYKIMT